MRTVVSWEADATYFPSGLKHTLKTVSVCPCVVGGCAAVAGRPQAVHACMHKSAFMLRLSARARIGARTAEMVGLASGFELRRRVQGVAMGDVYLGHGLQLRKGRVDAA